MSAPPTPREVVARASCSYRYGEPCYPANCDTGQCEAWLHADAILAALAAAGFAVVPREPTEAMHDAGYAVSLGGGAGEPMHAGFPSINARIYRAMLAAASPLDPALVQAFTSWTEGKSDG